MTDFSCEEQRQRGAAYREALVDDTVAFWLRHAIDEEHGGFLSCLDRDGTVLSTDKSIWIQGRFTWLLATMYSTVEPRPEWLEHAKRGLEFLDRYGFDDDGQMFFTVTRDGRPLRKRRYSFSEFFAIMAKAAVARATDDRALAEEAVALFRSTLAGLRNPERSPPKTDPNTRPMKGLGAPMITLSVAQCLRDAIDDPLCDQAIGAAAAEIARDFVNDELGVVLETVGPNGEFYDTLEGRLLCPGHSIEAAWFLLHEDRVRGGDEWLRSLGLKILDLSWERGWDREHGGILYYRDARDLPPTEYWHDMKFWWPQNEAIIATLLAWKATGEPRYLEWYRAVDSWAHEHFPDREHGEWFGYLHRDGRLSTRVKGNMWKGPFHIPRMQWYCAQLLEEASDERAL